MLIYDPKVDSFTKLALDWEALARFAKPALLGGGAGLAIGALLDVLFPSHRNKTLLGGLLGAAGGGLYSLLNYDSDEKPTDFAKELNEFNRLALLTRQPISVSGFSKLKDVLGYTDDSDLYLKTHELVRNGNVALLRSALRAQKDANELNTFHNALNDAMFERAVRLIAYAALDDPEDANAVYKRLADYLSNHYSYLGMSDKTSDNAKRALAAAQNAKNAIIDQLSSKNEHYREILMSPVSRGWELAQMLLLNRRL